jgi:hypothetical protein
MDETKKDPSMMGHGDMCHCGMCCAGMGHMHGHFGFWIVKLLVALVVLLFVFWLGVKVGEVKTYMEAGRYPMRANMMYYSNGGGTSLVSPAHPITPINPGGPIITVPTTTGTPAK